MTDLLHIVGKLREAAVQVKRECDGKVEEALTRMSKKIKQDIMTTRDEQLRNWRDALEQEEKLCINQKKQLEENMKQFEKLKASLLELLETHRARQKEFDEKIAKLQTKYNRIKTKQDKMASNEMTELCSRLNKKLCQKMNHCKCLMLRDDETLVKIHNMLTGHDS